MNLLKKIKLNYNLKLFEEHVSNKEFDLAYDFILDLKKNNQIDLFLLLKNSQTLLRDLPLEFYKKKIIWTVSYDLSDLSYINKFLDFYLSRNLNLSFKIGNFTNLLNDYFSNLDTESQKKDIVFDDFLSLSNLYQNLILFNHDNDYLFLNSCASFFETNKKNYFIYPNNTFCYFYIINTPEELLLRYKQNFGSSDASYDELFNFSDQQFLNKEQEDLPFKVYENRKGYNTNVKSWTDENVMNTFKGKIISYDKLMNQTQDVLIEILYHLRQFGMIIDINIDDVKNFILNNELNKKISGELSNNDKKFLDKNLDRTISFPDII